LSFSAVSFRQKRILSLFLILTLFSILISACSSAEPTVLTTSPAYSSTITTATASPYVTVAPTPIQTLEVSQSLTLEIGGFSSFVYFPVGLDKTEPAQILLVLHGMGGNGQAMGRILTDYADRYHMVLIAPSLQYNQNWKDISVIAKEDPAISAQLQNMIDQIPATLGLQIYPKVMLFGFSRGAQLAHRFAMFYPERVFAAAIISAGGYSLPVTNEPNVDQKSQPASKIMPFPFGVGDISHYTGHVFNREAFTKVQFVVEVGELDNKSADVPRDYDPYLGNNRLERARTFYKWLQQVGVHATFNTFPKAGHEITPEMGQMAFQFFRNAQQATNRNAA